MVYKKFRGNNAPEHVRANKKRTSELQRKGDCVGVENCGGRPVPRHLDGVEGTEEDAQRP